MIHIPHKTGYNKCFWKTIFSRPFTVLNTFTSSLQKPAHHLITLSVLLSLQNCSPVAIFKSCKNQHITCTHLSYDEPSSQLLWWVQVLDLILAEVVVVVSCQQNCQGSKSSQCVHPALVPAHLGTNPTSLQQQRPAGALEEGTQPNFFYQCQRQAEVKREFLKIFVTPMSSVFQRSIEPTFQRKRKIWRREGEGFGFSYREHLRPQCLGKMSSKADQTTVAACKIQSSLCC